MPRNPRLPTGSVPLWMLNDGSSINAKLDYMRMCRAGGIRGLALHPRSGNLIPYASSEWFSMVKAIVAEAVRLDMKVWLYDEDPYPSGAAGGMLTTESPDLRSQSLICLHKPEDVKPGDLWFISTRRVLWAGLVPQSNPGPARDLTHLIGPVRSDWFLTEWDSRYYYVGMTAVPCERGDAVKVRYAMHTPVIPKGYRLVALAIDIPGEDGTWNDLPDLLNPRTFAKFQDLILEPYRKHVGEYFGKRIPGIFTDEAKPHGQVPITGDLIKSFSAHLGYDLRPRLHQLFGEALDDEYAQTRIDYRRWVGERFLNAFVRPYARYCQKHRLLLVGHFSPEDDPIQEASTIVSVMPIMKELSLPGTDVIVPCIGNRKAPILNIGSLRANSVRSQTGKRYCMSETLALSGWQVTSQQVRHIYAWQKVLGIDRFFPHGFFQTAEGVTRFEAPPGYGPESPIFPGYCEVDAWLRTCEEILDGAVEVANVAILNAMTSFLTRSAEAPDASDKRQQASLWLTALNCLRAHVGIHLADEPDVAAAKSRNRVLQIGARAYTTVLVSAIGVIPHRVLASLQRANRSGVRVVWYGGGPTKVYDARNRLQQISREELPGEVVNGIAPAESWLRRNLLPQVLLSGAGRADCYVRRCGSRAGSEYLLAVNVGERDLSLTLKSEANGWTWCPVSSLTDGATSSNAKSTQVLLPKQACALFKLCEAPRRTFRRGCERRKTGSHRSFRRLQQNIFRLDRCTARLNAGPEQAWDYPRPYFQLGAEYAASAVVKKYVGAVPVESRPIFHTLAYHFVFFANDKLTPVLLLEPRSARGRFQIFLNGQVLGIEHRFPREGGRERQVCIPIRRGKNDLEIRFQLSSAMEGLLGPLFLKGDFDVLRRGSRLILEAPVGRDSRHGWQDAGLPHYMGACEYTWSEHLPVRTPLSGWHLDLDQVVDSAELFVNGHSCNRRAWRPWRWALPLLRKGENRFRLLVHSTASNRLALVCPDQPQGWIGHASLVREA